MDTNKIRDTPKRKKPSIKVWLGYDIEDILDLDDSGYGFDEEPIYCEVELEYERNK